MDLDLLAVPGDDSEVLGALTVHKVVGVRNLLRIQAHGGHRDQLDDRLVHVGVRCTKRI